MFVKATNNVQAKCFETKKQKYRQGFVYMVYNNFALNKYA